MIYMEIIAGNKDKSVSTRSDTRLKFIVEIWQCLVETERDSQSKIKAVL